MAGVIFFQVQGVKECRINVTSKNSKAAKVANTKVTNIRAAASPPSNGSPSESPGSSLKVKQEVAAKAPVAAGLRQSE